MEKLVLILVMIVSSALSQAASKTETLYIYSARTEPLIQPLFQKFEKETGVKVKFITGKAEALIQRLKSQRGEAKADVLITVDVGNLHQAQKLKLFEVVESSVLKTRIPLHLRDRDQKWYGFSVRSRSIFYNKDKVKVGELSSYEDLALPKWKGRLCLRTSKKVYNKSLVASLIHHHGEKTTEKIVKGWVNNLATSVFSSDSKLLAAIDKGQCDVGIANTYYFGRLLKKNPKTRVSLFWANQKGVGAHVNVSGAGVLKGSQNKKQAVRFLEWLSGEQAQKIFAESNMEYPAVQSVGLHPIVKGFGSFKQDKSDLSLLGELQVSAVRLMDRVGYK